MIPEGNSEKATVLGKFWGVLQELCVQEKVKQLFQKSHYGDMDVTSDSKDTNSCHFVKFRILIHNTKKIQNIISFRLYYFI